MYLLIYLAALLLAWLTPSPKAMLERLAAPRFAVREQASRDLQNCMTYGLAVKLETHPPAQPEARLRVRNALAAYWQVLPPGQDVPYIDSLNQKCLCSGDVHPIALRYLVMARSRGLSYPGQWGEYRAATLLWVAELQRSCVPPRLIRWTLAEMGWRSELYAALGCPPGVKIDDVAQYRRMPGSPANWVMTSVWNPKDGTFHQELRPK